MKDLKNNKQWQKYSDETALAYSYFQSYLELGSDRSLPKVCQKYTKKPSYLTQLKKWSAKFNWVQRAAAYDEEITLEALLSKKKIVNLVMGELLREARTAVRTIVSVMNMPNYSSGLNIKSNARERLKAAEMVLNRIGVIEETEKTSEKTKPMSVYQQIHRHLYGGGETEDFDEDYI